MTNVAATPAQALEAEAQARLDDLSRELEARFGWTKLDVSVRASGSDQALSVSGTLIAARVRHAVGERLRPIVPKGWRLDTSGLEPLRTHEFHRVEAAQSVWRTREPSAADMLSTELEPSDGPIELLARVDGASLVRAMDATVGWIRQQLGPPVANPRLAPPRSGTAASLVAALDSWLGTPYRLGGTRRSGIDCSGLVQRAFRESLGVILPRHSTDQLAWAERTEEVAPCEGDLIFVWNDREAPCHVGIVVGHGAERRVMHASHGRRRVVADPFDDFVRAARQVRSASLTDVVGRFRQFVGKSSIELLEVE